MRRDVPFNVVRGFCMGAADVVPGVSGGTIALIFGIYERLVHAVHSGAKALGSVAKGDIRAAAGHLRAIDWAFLISLLAGIGLAILSLARLLDHLLEDEPMKMTGLFFGLVAASIGIAWTHLGNRDTTRLAVLGVSAVLTFVAMGFKSAEASDPALWFLFAAGALAITAMILPGISGSFILLMLGAYEYVLDAVNERDLTVILVFGVGATLGLALFSSLLDWLLEHHHDTVMAALIGLMAGSLRVLWPWPEGIENAAVGAPRDDVVVPVLLAVVAGVAVFALGMYGRRIEAARGDDPHAAVHRSLDDQPDDQPGDHPGAEPVSWPRDPSR